MKIQITGRHLEVTPTLKEFIKTRLQKIEKYSFKITEALVVLDVEKYRHHAEITLFLNGLTFLAEDETEEMYATIDKVADKLEKQVKKHKEKVTHHRDKGGKKQLPEEIELETSLLSRIVKEKAFQLKPQSRESALLQMESLQKDFFIYLDDFQGKINVLYRRKQGDFGNIQLEV